MRAMLGGEGDKTMRTAWISAALLMTPLPAFAQTTVQSGHEVTLTIAADGTVSASDRGTVTPNKFETWAGALFASGKMDDAAGANARPMSDGEEGSPPTPTAPPDAVSVRFTATAQGQSLLVLANGYDRGMRYHAKLRRNGKSETTDVCIVMPQKTGLEHWPYPIDAIELTDIRLVPWQPEDGISCE